MEKIELVKRYFSLLERFASDKSDFEPLLHEGFKQLEFPNLLNRNGQESDFEQTIKRAATGGKMLSSQAYEITNTIESGDQVVVEAAWHGKMAVDAGPLSAGSEVRARFCIVCEFRDGKIIRQRNYDCFEPFK